MASTPEKKVKHSVRTILDNAGAYYFMPGTHGYGTSGVPDIIGCYKGRMFGIECKAGNNQPTALQEKHIARINAEGGYAIVVNENNIIDVLAMLGRIDRDAKRHN